jgi:hypothetical protein
VGFFDKLRPKPGEPEWINIGEVGAQDSLEKLKVRVQGLLEDRGRRGPIITYVNVIEPSAGFADQHPVEFQSHVLETLASTLPMLSEQKRKWIQQRQLMFVHGRTGERQRSAAVVALE